MVDSTFFNDVSEQSVAKSTIVSKYFGAWANVIISTQRRFPSREQKLAYIDLFAGPGRYKDGAQSTPVKVLTTAIARPELKKRLITIFNDKNKDFSKVLEQTISEIPGIESLTHKPIVRNDEVGVEIVKAFESMKLIPTLFFVDPWGYKGLSLRLVESVLKDWGCDAIFFFNYNRINMGISNDAVSSHMEALFGLQGAKSLKVKLRGLESHYRELMIVEELCQALKANAAKFVLPFRFKNSKGKRTSHHLIFVSKNFRGYEIMKDIMARESTSEDQGVPSFEYNPHDFLPKQGLLFELSKPLDDLRENLLRTYAGRTISTKELYCEHSIDTPYIIQNYKKVLRELFDKDIIRAVSIKGKPPRKGTFGDSIIATFPK